MHRTQNISSILFEKCEKPKKFLFFYDKRLKKERKKNTITWMFWHFLISCSRVKIVLTFIHHNHVIFYLEAKSHIRFIQHSAIVNTCSPCHAGRLDHMNSVHKWLLETKLDFIGLSVSVCACVLASVRVFCDIMSLRSHSQDCRGCCHGSAFWRPLFHDRGRWKKKHCTEWLILKTSLSFGKHHTVWQFPCTPACICVYEFTERLRAISMNQMT